MHMQLCLLFQLIALQSENVPGFTSEQYCWLALAKYLEGEGCCMCSIWLAAVPLPAFRPEHQQVP